ncbi:MAG: hypothetical protein DRI26_08965, partial [Chloroflexi bacterium]
GHPWVEVKSIDGPTLLTLKEPYPVPGGSGTARKAFKVELDPEDNSACDVRDIGLSEKFYRVTSEVFRQSGATLMRRTPLIYQAPYPGEGTPPYQVSLLSWEMR